MDKLVFSWPAIAAVTTCITGNVAFSLTLPHVSNKGLNTNLASLIFLLAGTAIILSWPAMLKYGVKMTIAGPALGIFMQAIGLAVGYWLLNEPLPPLKLALLLPAIALIATAAVV